MQAFFEEKPEISSYVSKAEERFVFFLVFVGVLALTYGFLFLIDFIPEKSQADAEDVRSVTIESPRPTNAPSDTVIVSTHDDTIEKETSGTRIDVGSTPIVSGGQYEHAGEVDPYPKRIIFDALGGRAVTVLNPEARSVEALDTALLSGVVRHPDSADFERTGTIFLFGHSSYLPNVMNKNFQAFNGIQKMTWGDTIRLQSSETEYVYRVDRVYEVSADDAEVKIETGKAKLTLVTCDSFGSKSDRFVVEATLIEERPLE